MEQAVQAKQKRCRVCAGTYKVNITLLFVLFLILTVEKDTLQEPQARALGILTKDILWIRMRLILGKKLCLA